VSSPDWRVAMRGGLGGGVGLLWSVLFVHSFCSGAVLFGSGRVKVVELAQVVELPRVWSESVQSRDPASGTERLPFAPRPHEKAPENPSIPPETPSELSGVRRGRRAARAVRAPRRRDSRGGRQVDDATREVTTSFFFGLCVNDCGWRLSDQVELFKCCRVSVLVGGISFACVLLLCWNTRFCFIVHDCCEYVPSVLSVCVINSCLFNCSHFASSHFFLLTLHPTSRKRFVAGFQNPGN